MGLQKGKNNQNDMGLVKCHHIMTNTAHGCATSEKWSKFLDIPSTWGYTVHGSKDDFKTDLDYSTLVDWASGKRFKSICTFL